MPATSLSEMERVPADLLRRAIEMTAANATFFNAPHGFAGFIAGVHEVLRRQGLFESVWCRNANEGLSSGQMEEIDRVYRHYPHLNDDIFVAAGHNSWLRP